MASNTYYSDFYPSATTVGTKGTTIAVVPTTIVSTLRTDVDQLRNDVSAAAAADTTPPNIPNNLALTSVLSESGVVLSASWSPSTSSDVAGYALLIKEGAGNEVSFTSAVSPIEIRAAKRNQAYSARVAAVDKAGNYSAYSSVVTYTTVSDNTPPPQPTNFGVLGGLSDFWLSWILPAGDDFASVIVARSTGTITGDPPANAIMSLYVVNAIGGQGGGVTDGGYGTPRTYTYWIRIRDTSGNLSAWSPPKTATNASLTYANFTPGLTPTQTVANLPNPVGYTGPTSVFNQADGKLYNYSSGIFVPATVIDDLSISGSKLVNGAVGINKFASGLTPIEIVTSLPTVGNYDGRVVYYNQKLYRWIFANQIWSSTVPTTDLTGSISDAQIETLAASKVTGQLTNAQIAAIDAAKVSGMLTDAQITSLSATKIAGQLTNTQIADIAAAKLTGQITSTQITDGSISTAKIVAGAIVASKIASDTITSNEIAANAITASELSANSVTAAKIVAGTITANEIAANTITASKIAARTITANEIVAGSVTAFEIAANTITAAKIAAGTITANEITAYSLTGDRFVARTITAAQIATGTLTANEIAANTITAGQIAAATITATQIASRTINADRIATGTLTANEIATNAITANKLVIASRSISTVGMNMQVVNGVCSWNSFFVQYPSDNNSSYVGQQISAGSLGSNGVGNYIYFYVLPGLSILQASSDYNVTVDPTIIMIATWDGGTNLAPAGGVGTLVNGDRIVTGTISANKIVANSITANQIQAGTITAAQLAVDAISAEKLQVGSVTTVKIQDGAIVANKIAVNAITADKILANSITGDRISTATALPGTITIGTSGVQIGVTQAQAASSATINWFEATGGIDDQYIIRSNKVTKRQPSGYFANVYSKEQYGSGATLTGSLPSLSRAFMALTDNRNYNNSNDWNQFSYSFWRNSDGQLQAIESGVQYPLTTNTPANANLQIVYDGKAIKYYIDGGLVRTVNTTANRVFIAATNIGDIGGYVDGFRFGPSMDNSLSNADPANAINTKTTQIDPGRILISDGTSLANWRSGTDSTKIEGGNIAANTITANKLTIGNRAISVLNCIFQYNPTDGKLYWSQGEILYTNDNGAAQSVAINPGSVAWLGGYANYIVWTKDTGTFTSNADAWENVMTSTNQVIMCTWRNGPNFNPNYGGTIIDGSKITTGTVNADRIQAGTVTAVQIAAGSISADRLVANSITAGQIAAASITGDRIVANTIEATQIKAGTITADRITINGVTTDRLSFGATGRASIYVDEGTISFSDSTNWTNIATIQMTSKDGQPIKGQYSGILTDQSGGSTQVYMRLLRDDGTALRFGSNGVLIAARDEGESIAFHFLDSVNAGRATTWYVQMKKKPGTSHTVAVSGSYMSVEETSRNNYQYITVNAPSGEGAGAGTAGGGTTNGTTTPGSGGNVRGGISGTQLQ